MGKSKSRKSDAKVKSADRLMKSEPIAADPNLMASDFEGLVSFEEITDYNVTSLREITRELKLNNKKNPKKSKKLKRLLPEAGEKLSKNAPEITRELKLNHKKNLKKSKKLKRLLPEAGEKLSKNAPEILAEMGWTQLEGMEAWAGLGISEPLLKALMLKKFTTPTQVQALSIPPAILGRRDILGAAETGSGKTLAFGLPILQGILIQKELTGKTASNVTEKDNHNVSDCEEDNEPEMVLSENISSENEDEGDEDGGDEDGGDEDGGDEDGGDEDGGDEYGDENYELVEDDFDENSSDNLENAEDLGCVKVVPNAIFNVKNEYKKYRQKPLYALILTPTRELAVQIRKHITDAAALTDIKVALVVGGLSSQKQERLLNYGPEIVVGTPGRLWELIQQGHPHFDNIENIKFLAIDETDRMLEKGHFEELTQLLALLNHNKPEGVRRQNFLFSATLTLVHAPPSYIKKFKKKNKSAQLTPEAKLQNIVKQMGLQNPKVVDITQPNCVPETLKEARIICSTEDKDFYLYYFLKLHPGRTLVFCNSIGCVQRLHSLFTLLECSPYPLHSNLQQRQRLKNLERFTQNPNSILVATDVAARGLDVPNVKHVIHYQVPRTAESYVHRSGRTARASEDGLTVLLMDGSEVRTYTKIFNTLKRDPILPDFPVENKYLIKVKDRVKLARRLDTLELRAKRLSSEESWVKKAVTEMDIELSDDDLPIRSSKGEVNDAKKKAAAMRKQLQGLTKQPLFDPVEQLSRKAFITSGIKSDGSYAGVSGPKPSAVKALEAAVAERKDRKKKRKLEQSKMKQGSIISSNTATKTDGQDTTDKSADSEHTDAEVAESVVEYPDFSQRKRKKRKD